jgi:hypothetical protein
MVCLIMASTGSDSSLYFSHHHPNSSQFHHSSPTIRDEFEAGRRGSLPEGELISYRGVLAASSRQTPQHSQPPQHPHSSSQHIHSSPQSSHHSQHQHPQQQYYSPQQSHSHHSHQYYHGSHISAGEFHDQADAEWVVSEGWLKGRNDMPFGRPTPKRPSGRLGMSRP